MTAALSSRSPSDRHWLLRYLRLQQASDRRVQAALHATLDSAVRAVSALDGKPGVSAAVQRAQLLGTRGVVATVMKELFQELGDIIARDQQEAASLAAKLLYEDEARIWKTIETNKSKREQIETSLDAKARRNVQAMMIRILGLEVPLSTRVYRAEALSRNYVTREINVHLGRGSSAKEMAKSVRSLIDPSVKGGVSYAATRLARTEINNAFHAQSIADAQDRPWIQEMTWHLSKSHPPRQPPCLCDKYAAQGRFPTDEVPNKPHPNCLCYTTSVLPDLNEAMARLENGEFEEYRRNL